MATKKGNDAFLHSGLLWEKNVIYVKMWTMGKSGHKLTY